MTTEGTNTDERPEDGLHEFVVHDIHEIRREVMRELALSNAPLYRA